MDPHAPHAVVIGAGFGGLAAAVRLGARGYRVTVVDRLDQPGGRARVFRDQGFVYDAGPTIITAPFLLEELWELAGERMSDHVELLPVTPFYRIRFDDGSTFNYTGDTEAMCAEIARFSPEDVAGYRKFLERSEAIFKVGFQQLADVPFNSAMDMLRIVPDMIKLGSHRTVYQMVSKYIRHPKIRQVLSFHPLLVGGNPFSVTSIYSLIAYLEREWGVWFARGGTGALVQGLVRLIENQGSEVRLNAEVAQITLDGQRATGVRLASGEQIDADVVISNADAAWTYRNLLPASARSTWTDRKLERTNYSMSLFVWYFGTDRVYEDVEHHTILLGPRYEGLLRDIFGNKHLAEDFSLYLHRPTKTDPKLAPQGKDTFYVLSPVPHLDSGVDWSTTAERYRQAVSDYLEEAVMPGLSKHIVSSRVLTPQGFRDDYLSVKGAAFSIEPRLSRSAYFRPHNQSEDIEGLYLVGAGTHPGAGVPGVLSTARVLDRIVPDPAALRRTRAPRTRAR
jgi:phytoene desaturase